MADVVRVMVLLLIVVGSITLGYRQGFEDGKRHERFK